MKRAPALAAALAVAALALGACGGSASGTEAPAPSSTSASGPSPSLSLDLVVLTVEGESASATVYVELARTSAEIQTGLMHREHLDEDRGMLFIFEAPSHTGFWMKNTLIPLDIAYMDDQGRIREIHHGKPLSEELLLPDLPYSYVLEVNAGWFERHGLGPGARAIIPSRLGGG